jgi:2'-5' RNA ligase
MRAFVSVDLGGFEAAVESVQHEFAEVSGLDFVPPETVHVTLSFLGDVAAKRLPTVTEAIGDAVAESGASPFEAEFGGLGVFPSREYIRVLWIGLGEGSEELTRLHERIEARIAELGFEPDEHDFTPHATIARMRHAGGKRLVQEKLDDLDPAVGTMTVEEVRLTKSTLTDEGPVYETVERFEL